MNKFTPEYMILMLFWCHVPYSLIGKFYPRLRPILSNKFLARPIPISLKMGFSGLFVNIPSHIWKQISPTSWILDFKYWNDNIYCCEHRIWPSYYCFFPFNLFNIFVDNKIKLNNPDLLLAAIDAQFANFVERDGFNFVWMIN